MRLPSDPSLERDEGGVKGRPYDLAIGGDVINVPPLEAAVSDLMVNLGIITFCAGLRIICCDLSRLCEDGVSCKQPS